MRKDNVGIIAIAFLPGYKFFLFSNPFKFLIGLFIKNDPFRSMSIT